MLARRIIPKVKSALYFYLVLAGVALRAPPARRTMAFMDKEPSLQLGSLSNKACLTKFRSPMFCFHLKEKSNTSSIQKASLGSHFKNSTFWQYHASFIFIHSFKEDFCAKDYIFWTEEVLIISVFLDSRTNRVRKTGCFHPG